ncbi:MAG: tetratricopeptide repeat protein [Saprospiraceae bacterium]
MFQKIIDNLFLNSRHHRSILVCLVILLYSNTLLNDFAVDDSIVIVKNEFTKKGIEGIPDILNKDTFRGFFKTEGKEKLVSGGRYRPLSLVLFALVYQIVGSNPFYYHLLNILFFAFLTLIFYELLKKLLQSTFKLESTIISFLAAILFAVHPIHTECVANVKGMDEILALLLSLSSFLFALKWFDSSKLIHLLVSSLLLLMALFSKENSISYLVLIPLGLLLFNKNSLAKSSKAFLFLLVSSFIFLYCRAQILGWNPIAGHSMELMNNPFLKYINGRYIDFTGGEKMGTIFFTLLKYVGLLFFPHPLTYDYYPKQIAIHTFSSGSSLFALALYCGLIYFALKNWKTNPIVTFSIFAYLIPLFIVSNIVFSVGTFMGERFIFMPSVGFCILMAYFINKFRKQSVGLTLSLFLISIILFSFKTITRNEDWKDDMSLILHDSKISSNSAKINAAVGGILLERYAVEQNPKILAEKINIAKKHLNKAIELHPYYFEAYTLLGNAHFMAKEYKQAVEKYDFLMKYQSENKDAPSNMALFYKEWGRVTGMNENNPRQAIVYLKTSLQLNPKDEETISLLGVAHGVLGEYEEAIRIFNNVLQLNPKSSDAYFNLYLTYLNQGDSSKAEECLNKAKSIDPNIMEKFNKIGK